MFNDFSQMVFAFAFGFAVYISDFAALLFQTASGLNAYEVGSNLTMGAAFIGTCIVGFRYFTKQVEKKDEQLEKYLDKFVVSIDASNKANSEHSMAMNKISDLYATSHLQIIKNQKEILLIVSEISMSLTGTSRAKIKQFDEEK